MCRWTQDRSQTTFLLLNCIKLSRDLCLSFTKTLTITWRLTDLIWYLFSLVTVGFCYANNLPVPSTFASKNTRQVVSFFTYIRVHLYLHQLWTDFDDFFYSTEQSSESNPFYFHENRFSTFQEFARYFTRIYTILWLHFVTINRLRVASSVVCGGLSSSAITVRVLIIQHLSTAVRQKSISVFTQIGAALFGFFAFVTKYQEVWSQECSRRSPYVARCLLPAVRRLSVML